MQNEMITNPVSENNGPREIITETQFIPSKEHASKVGKKHCMNLPGKFHEDILLTFHNCYRILKQKIEELINVGKEIISNIRSSLCIVSLQLSNSFLPTCTTPPPLPPPILLKSYPINVPHVDFSPSSFLCTQPLTHSIFPH